MSENTAKEKSVKEEPSLAIADVAKVFEDRNKLLVDAFNKETNVANRYDLKVRLEELAYLYNELMGLLSK